MRTAQPGEVLRKVSLSLLPELKEGFDRGDAILKDERDRNGKPDAGEEHHGGQDQDPDPGRSPAPVLAPAATVHAHVVEARHGRDYCAARRRPGLLTASGWAHRSPCQ